VFHAFDREKTFHSVAYQDFKLWRIEARLHATTSHVSHSNRAVYRITTNVSTAFADRENP
jgi:hypothetical protein